MLTEVLNTIKSFLYYSNLGNMLTALLSDSMDLDVSLLHTTEFYQIGADLIGLLAIGLTMIYLCIYIVNALLDEKMTREFVFTAIIRFVAVWMLIKYGPTVLSYLIDFGNDILAGITEAYTFTENPGNMNDMDMLGGVFSIFIFFITLVPNVIIILITMTSIYFVSFSRYTELAIYTVGFPLAMPNIMLYGKNSSSIKYIRKFFALCLQGAVMMLIVICCSVFFNNTMADSLLTGSTFFASLVGMGPIPAFITAGIVSFIENGAIVCMLLSMLFRSKKIAMDILGVR